MPDQVRTKPKRQNADDTLKIILSSLNKPPPDSQNTFAFKSNILGKQPDYMETERDLYKLKNVYDWHFMFLSSAKNSAELKIFIGKLAPYFRYRIIESDQFC